MRWNFRHAYTAWCCGSCRWFCAALFYSLSFSPISLFIGKLFSVWQLVISQRCWRLISPYNENRTKTKTKEKNKTKHASIDSSPRTHTSFIGTCSLCRKIRRAIQKYLINSKIEFETALFRVQKCQSELRTGNSLLQNVVKWATNFERKRIKSALRKQKASHWIMFV